MLRIAVEIVSIVTFFVMLSVWALVLTGGV